MCHQEKHAGLGAERKIGVFKRIMNNVFTMDIDIALAEARPSATPAMSELDRIGRHSPFEQVLDRNWFKDDEAR